MKYNESQRWGKLSILKITMENQKNKVLIFDVDAFLRAMYSEKFQKSGFDCRAFADVEDVIEKVLKEKPDAILMDLIVMPSPNNGLDATKILKNDARTAHIPILIFSNMGQSSDIEKGKTSGATEYLIKAELSPEEVIGHVNRAILESRRNKGKEFTMDRKYKILVVDDDKFLLSIYSTKIKELGLDVETLAAPTKDFTQRVTEIKPDLIALDIVMPGIDGFEAIQMLKADQRTKDIPVMFESNMSQAEDIKKGVSLGAVDYIVIAWLTSSEVVKSYFDYLCDPQHYVQRYPIFLEVAKTKFSGNHDERNEVRDSFIQKRFVELGIKISSHTEKENHLSKDLHLPSQTPTIQKKEETNTTASFDFGRFIWKIIKICLFLLSIVLAIWLTVALGPLWIIALILLGILIVLNNR